MLRFYQLLLCLPLVASSSALSLGADSPAIATLKEKGLTRSGRFFVVEGEKTVLDKWKETRGALAEYAAAAERKKEAELAARDLAQLEERRTALQARLDELNQQINVQGFQQAGSRAGGFGQGAYLTQLISQRDMIRMYLTDVVATQQSFKADAGTDKKALESESEKNLQAAKAALTDLRASVNAVLKRYDELKSDASVKSALQALEKDKAGTFKIGPSTAFNGAVKSFETIERKILATKTTAVSRKKRTSKK
jgi:hypothetical protein